MSVLDELAKKLTCGSCGENFKGTYHQAKHVKYSNRIVYCSDDCKKYARNKKRMKRQKALPTKVCQHCGDGFKSKTAKQFCSLKCYNKSDKFKKISADALKKASKSKTRAPRSKESILKSALAQRTGKYVNCNQCDTSFYRKPSMAVKSLHNFCSQICYREFKAGRFDRHIATPEEIALPQGYDEFLSKDELPCLLNDCDWTGKHLSLHMNLAHGVKADEFKKMAGFNLGAGVVSKVTAQKQRDNALESMTDKSSTRSKLMSGKMDCYKRDNIPSTYKSFQAVESMKKARLLSIMSGAETPTRKCENCGKIFKQSTVYGRAKYCTIKCRNEKYKLKNKRGE